MADELKGWRRVAFRLLKRASERRPWWWRALERVDIEDHDDVFHLGVSVLADDVSLHLGKVSVCISRSPIGFQIPDPDSRWTGVDK